MLLTESTHYLQPVECWASMKQINVMMCGESFLIMHHTHAPHTTHTHTDNTDTDTHTHTQHTHRHGHFYFLFLKCLQAFEQCIVEDINLRNVLLFLERMRGSQQLFQYLLLLLYIIIIIGTIIFSKYINPYKPTPKFQSKLNDSRFTLWSLDLKTQWFNWFRVWKSSVSRTYFSSIFTLKCPY